MRVAARGGMDGKGKEIEEKDRPDDTRGKK